MAISGGVEGGEVTEVSGGGVVGHSADKTPDRIPSSRDYKGVSQINEAGPAIDIHAQWSADINIINYSLDIVFQCEGWLGHLASTGHSLHAAAAAVSPDEEGGVGGGLEPGTVVISSHTQPGVQQLPAS